MQNLPNSHALAYDDIYGPIWEATSVAYTEIAGQDVTTLDVGGDDGGLTVSKTDKPDPQIVMESCC